MDKWHVSKEVKEICFNHNLVPAEEYQDVLAELKHLVEMLKSEGYSREVYDPDGRFELPPTVG